MSAATAGRPTLLGVGYDASASYLPGAAGAPLRIREALHAASANGFSETGRDVLAAGVLGDDGDLSLPPNASAREMIERGVRAIVSRGDVPLSLGGDHSITYPIIKGFGDRARGATIVQIDAHPDLYDAFEGNRFSHACQFARILEEGLVGRLVQVGIRTLTAHQRQQVARFGVEVIDMRAWASGARPKIDGPVYISLDLDGLDPAFAPGVSHHEPGGLSTRDVLSVIHALRGPIIGADVVELNPLRDVHDVTAMVAAKFVKEIASQVLDTAAS